MNAETFNSLYEVGVPVFAYPGCRPEDDRNATRLVTRTRTKAQTSASGDAVVWVDGEGSYICLTHVDPVPESVWQVAKKLEETESAAPVLPVPVGDQPQPLDDQRLAQDLAAYEGHPDLGFACCTAHAVADHVPALLAEVELLRGQQAKDDAEYEKATAELDAARARIAELERPAIEAKRNEVRNSFTELAAAAHEDRDYEGAFSLECQLREREEQWKHEDEEAAR
ncbi:hypothetical protein GCM10010293_39910 [Streptomyces griseoflavus]|uniref:hypothetical protein n=1 Tax=Streptomyces griseoflavus TaxID=35619 RepID=UPI00167D01E7|nr:hypothetical protein [Streptomyces griseoflavus]GGV36571.1 hypothetical protein GCM10010293_39910 [Streptomyces griseoflavus]